MSMITRTWEWSPYPWNKAYPVPLCFTIPAGNRSMVRPGYLATGGALRFIPPRQKLMMDPTDQSTWQRPYRFT
jgi:hypothetical protein